MITTWASMSCALSHLPSTPHPLLDKARLHLEVGVALADSYTKTWHSIIWIKSRVGKKKGVRRKLDCIAFDTYTELVAAATYINEYIEEVGEEGVSEEFIASMNRAYYSIWAEHGHQLSSKQLELM